MAGEPEVEEEVAAPPAQRPRIVVTPNPFDYSSAELGPSAFDALETENKAQPSGPVYDDTEVKETRRPSPASFLQNQQELQGAIPDAEPQDIVDQREAPKPIALQQQEQPKLGPSAFDALEQQDAAEQPYQEAANIPKGFLRNLERAITPHVPPPPSGHNMPPPGMGLPPHVPPPPTAAPPPMAPVPPSGSKILYGVSDQKPFDFHDLYTQTMDDLHPIKQLQKAAEDIAPLGADEKPYELSRLTRGSYGRSHQAITNATFDFKTLKNNGMGLTDVLHPVKDRLREFDEYARSMRTVELHGRGINSGQPLAEAQANIAAAPPEFKFTLPALHNYQDRILQYARDSGILSKESYNTIKAANQQYVPLHRAMQPTKEGGLAQSLQTWNPIKKIKGSDRDTLSPIETIVRNTHHLMDLAEKNRALNALVDMAEARGGLGGLVTKMPPGTHPINVTQGEVEKFLTSNGVPVPGAFYGAPDHFTIFRPDAMRPGPDTIVAYKNGKAHMYKVDPEVADAVNGMGHQQVSMVVKAMSFPARVLRAGATLSPDFLTKNPARDQFVAASLSKNGYIPIVDYVRGLGHMLGNTEQYQMWLKSGGANSAIVGMDRKYIESELRNLMQTGLWEKTKTNFKHPFEFLSKLSEYGEQPTRIAEFIKATNPGFIRRNFANPKSVYEAGYESREITTDFGRHGSDPLLRGLEQQTAFMNPAKQGIDRFGRAIKDNPGAMAFKLAAFSTVPTAALYWNSRSDPRIADAPRWERDLVWYWPTHDWQEISPTEAKAYPKNWVKNENGKNYVDLGTIYKWPKAFEIGIAGGSVLERTLDAYFQKYPNAWKDFDKTMLQAFTPSVVPTWALPVAEAQSNYSVFRQRPLVSKRIENPADRRYEYDNYTSDAAKLVGSAIANISPTNQLSSPKVIENYALGWSATLGRYALQMADLALHQVAPKKGQPYPAWKGEQAKGYEAPAWTAADMPVLRSWVSRMPSTFAEPVDEFFQNYHSATTTQATQKRLIRRDEKDAATAAREQVPNVNLRQHATAIGNQFKMIEMIQNANNIPAADKTKLINRLSLGIMKTAQSGNEAFYKMQGKKPAQ